MDKLMASSKEHWKDCGNTELDPMKFLYQNFLKGKKLSKWCQFYYDKAMEKSLSSSLDPRIFFCATSCVIDLDQLWDIPYHENAVRRLNEMSCNELFWILRNCLRLEKLVVKDSKVFVEDIKRDNSYNNSFTGSNNINSNDANSNDTKRITNPAAFCIQQFFTQMTNKHEMFRNSIESLHLHYMDYNSQVVQYGDKMNLFLYQNRTVRDITLIGKNFGDNNALIFSRRLQSTPAVSLHLKDDTITDLGIAYILRTRFVKTSNFLKFEIPLSKELFKFLLQYFEDDDNLDISYFELVQYPETLKCNETDANKECTELMCQLRDMLEECYWIKEYKFDGFGVTFDSKTRNENIRLRFIRQPH